MADVRKYQTDELLNKVLNSGEDALKVDVDNVTLTTEGGDVAIDVALDKANDSVTIYANTAADGSGTSTVPLVDAAGHTQVDIVSSALPSGGATAANQATIIGHVDGVETLLGTIDSDTDAIKTAVQLLDNAVDGNYLNVNANIAGTDFVGGAGAVAAGVQRVTLASDDPAVTDLAAMEVLLTGIDEDTNAIKTDAAAIEVLITSTNSKIDTFDAVLDAIKVDTGTIDSDTNDIKTATESSNTHLGNMFYDTALAVTPSDGSDLSGEPYFAVWVGTGGDLKVDMASGTGTVTLSNCASGQLIPIMVERIYSTGTTASNIIVFK
tara:strand:+ start:606 stop:1574 length:969 start_codon:yes stop_codon:yes gene_type:complete